MLAHDDRKVRAISHPHTSVVLAGTDVETPDADGALIRSPMIRFPPTTRDLIGSVVAFLNDPVASG